MILNKLNFGDSYLVNDLCFLWTREKKWEGAVTGILAGFYLLVVGVLAWIITGNPQAFYLDSFRGLLTIIFGYLTYSNFKGG